MSHELEFVRRPYEDVSSVMDFDHYSYLNDGFGNMTGAPPQIDYAGHSIDYNQNLQVPRPFEESFLDPKWVQTYANSNFEHRLSNQCMNSSEKHINNAPLRSYWPSQSVEYAHNTHSSGLLEECFADTQSVELYQSFNAKDNPRNEVSATSEIPFTSIGSSALVPQMGLKRPTSQDWKSWQPMITASYRHSTAPMIMEELRSHGFQVT